MNHFRKTLVVVAVLSMGAFVFDAGSRADELPLTRAILKKEHESAEEKIASALDKPTNVEFLDLALEDCLTFLKEYHGINVWLDKQTVTEEGVSLDQPITLKLAEVRLESVLNLLLQPLQLDFVVQDEVLKITTSAWTYDHPETQTYDIANLIETGHSPEELIAAISKCIEPGTWTGKEATAGISHTGGVLVVRHTQRAHRDVARLLADLDDIAEKADEERHDGKKDAVVSIKVYSTFDQPGEKIAAALEQFVAPNSWISSNDRDGGGEVRALKGALIVKQTAAVHRSIHQFLTQFDPKLRVEPKSRVDTLSGAVQEEPAMPAEPAAAARASHDPFGVLDQTRRPAAGNGKAARADRPKSPLKKYKRTVASMTVPAK
jgi:hypothetical protein